MSTEHLNNEVSPPALDPERESDILYFVESLNENPPKATKPQRQRKWVAALRRRFHRRTLTLIAATTATVILAGIVIAILPSTDEESLKGPTTITPDVTEKEEKEKITLVDKRKTRLQQVTIQNTQGDYSIAYDETAKDYTLIDYEDITMSNNMIDILCDYTKLIQANDKVKDASALSAYGLDKPQATATISYADKTSTCLSIGNKTPSETGYYGQIEGDDSVYIFDVNSVTMFCHGSVSFADTMLISSPTVKSDDKYGQALMKEVTYSGTAHNNPLTIRRSNHTDSEDLAYFSYIITAPYLRSTSDMVSNHLGSLQKLSADQALYLHPTAEQKTKLGFDNPLIVLDITMAVETEEESKTDSEEETKKKIYYNAVDYKLIIGSIDSDGNYIVMLDGINAIFLIEKGSYDFLLERNYHNSVNEYLFFKNINTLERISIEMNGKKHDFHLTHYPDKENPDQQLTVTSDGKVYSTEEFRELYTLIMALKRNDVTVANPSGTVSMTLALYDTEGNLYLSADYYETTATLCTVQTSQGEVLTTLWSDVTFFIQQVENYLAGKNVLIKN